MKFPCAQTSARYLSAFAMMALLSPVRIALARQAAPSSPQRQDSRIAGNITLKHGSDAEDWNSVLLDRSTLHAEKPFLGEKDDLPDFTRELLQVQWRLGDPIDLYVIRPAGTKKPAAIVYLYSYPADTDRFRDDAFCRRITRGGFAAIGFASALTGHRYHDRPMKEWFVSELQESLVTSAHDVQMILDYLATRGDLDMEHVGMFGQGSGGTIAILAAAVDARIKALDLLNPWGDWPDWLANSARVPDTERANYLKPEFLKRVAPFDPIQWLPKLGARSIRIQDVADDPITPEICKRQIESAAPRTSIQLVHYENNRGLLDASSGGKLFEWIKDHLQPASADRAAK